MNIEAQKMDPREMYHFMNSIIIPRPIAWVSTISKSGISNIAPHSYFNIVTANPPIIAFSTVGLKDTYRNISETGEFVINVVDEHNVEKANASSERFPPEVSEFTRVGLTELQSISVQPPRVGESPISLECKVYKVLEIPPTPTFHILGEIVHIHVQDEMFINGR
ncbi:MAG: flavin reductase family protein, partial [Bacilli bacterium]